MNIPLLSLCSASHCKFCLSNFYICIIWCLTYFWCFSNLFAWLYISQNKEKHKHFVCTVFAIVDPLFWGRDQLNTIILLLWFILIQFAFIHNFLLSFLILTHSQNLLDNKNKLLDFGKRFIFHTKSLVALKRFEHLKQNINKSCIFSVFYNHEKE